jgi:hypothetical protein
MKPRGFQELQLHKHELVHGRFSMVPIPRFLDGFHAPRKGQTSCQSIKTKKDLGESRVFPH